MARPVFIFSVDVEEWFQVENLRPLCPFEKWPAMESRVEESVGGILKLFSEENVTRATFFVLGWVAERHPGMVRKIADHGFEIASHGMNHVSNFELSPELLSADLRESKDLLEKISGRQVLGYRAPSFTIKPEIIDELRAQGYRYDSSFNDVALHDRYGRLDLSAYVRTGPNLYRHPSSDFFELPVSNLEFAGMKIPWGGGGYFRLWPSWLYRWGVGKQLARDHLFTFYMHPWEIDGDQPRLPVPNRFSRFRHYNNLDKTLSRLSQLIRFLKSRNVEFHSMADCIGNSL